MKQGVMRSRSLNERSCGGNMMPSCHFLSGEKALKMEVHHQRLCPSFYSPEGETMVEVRRRFPFKNDPVRELYISRAVQGRVRVVRPNATTGVTLNNPDLRSVKVSSVIQLQL